MKQIEQFKYEVDELLNLRIWDTNDKNSEGAPFIYQPNRPDGINWESAEEAESWAVEFINDRLNPSQPEVL